MNAAAPHRTPFMPSATDTCSPDEVLAAFCRLRVIRPEDLLGATRGPQAVARARYELWWLMRHLTVLSQLEIGEMFRRDQSSISEGVRVTADRLAADTEYRQNMQQLVVAIRAHRDRNSDPPADVALTLGRRVLQSRTDQSADAVQLAITLVSIAAILRSRDLTDAEARLAAQTLIRNGGGSAHDS